MKPRARAAWSAAALALVVGLPACQFDPYTPAYATAKPDARDVIGVWRPAAEARSKLGSELRPGADPRIEIEPGGAFRAVDLPREWLDSWGGGAGADGAVTGRWALARHQERWWGIRVDGADWSCDGCLMVLGKKWPYRLVLRRGDPDAGEGLEFEKAGR